MLVGYIAAVLVIEFPCVRILFVLELLFPLVAAVPFRVDLRYCLDFTLFIRNKTAFVNEFKWAVFNVIPNMKCRFPFSSSVSVPSIVRRTMAQMMQGGNSTVTEMRIFVANLLIFRSKWLAGNISTVFL